MADTLKERKRRLREEMVQEARALSESGMRIKDIGAMLGVTGSTLSRWGLSPNNPRYRKHPNGIKRVTFVVDAAVFAEMITACEIAGMSRSSWFEDAIVEKLNRESNG